MSCQMLVGQSTLPEWQDRLTKFEFSEIHILVLTPAITIASHLRPTNVPMHLTSNPGSPALHCYLPMFERPSQPHQSSRDTPVSSFVLDLPIYPPRQACSAAESRRAGRWYVEARSQTWNSGRRAG